MIRLSIKLYINPHINEFNGQIGLKIAESNRQNWTQTVEYCSHKSSPTRLWGLIKSLNGKHAGILPIHQFFLRIPQTKQRYSYSFMPKSSPPPSITPATHLLRLLSVASSGNGRLIIRCPFSPSIDVVSWTNLGILKISRIQIFHEFFYPVTVLFAHEQFSHEQFIHEQFAHEQFIHEQFAH